MDKVEEACKGWLGLACVVLFSAGLLGLLVYVGIIIGWYWPMVTVAIVAAIVGSAYGSVVWIMEHGWF